MNSDLQSALRECFAATAEIDPHNLDAEDLVLWHACDRRIEQIVDRLINEFDEAGPLARAIIRGIARM